jgi:hypothetical protein
MAQNRIPHKSNHLRDFLKAQKLSVFSSSAVLLFLFSIDAISSDKFPYLDFGINDPILTFLLNFLLWLIGFLLPIWFAQLALFFYGRLSGKEIYFITTQQVYDYSPNHIRIFFIGRSHRNLTLAALYQHQMNDWDSLIPKPTWFFFAQLVLYSVINYWTIGLENDLLANFLKILMGSSLIFWLNHLFNDR